MRIFVGTWALLRELGSWISASALSPMCAGFGSTKATACVSWSLCLAFRVRMCCTCRHSLTCCALADLHQVTAVKQAPVRASWQPQLPASPGPPAKRPRVLIPWRQVRAATPAAARQCGNFSNQPPLFIASGFLCGVGKMRSRFPRLKPLS